jgi:hypothetical protein
LWYSTYWGYYWGPYYYDPVGWNTNVGYAGCSQWRAVLAFAFMAAITYLVSSILVSSSSPIHFFYFFGLVPASDRD